MKKALSLLACGAMAFTFALAPAHAAEGINDNEQKILDYVENGFDVMGETMDVSVYYDDVYEMLNTDGIDLTAADTDQVIAAAKDTRAFLELHWEDEVTAELVTELINKMSPATEVLGITLSYDAAKEQIIMKDANGNIIDAIDFPLGETPKEEIENEKEEVLENTGENFTSTYAIIGGLMVLLAGAGYLTLSKKEN